jgi:hypothetical protein
MNLEEHCGAIASRSGRSSFVPILISLLPMLLNGCVKAEEPNTPRVKAYVERHTKKRHKRERFEARFAEKAMEQDPELTEDDALQMAKDTVDHILELPVEEVTACCRSIETT